MSKTPYDPAFLEYLQKLSKSQGKVTQGQLAQLASLVDLRFVQPNILQCCHSSLWVYQANSVLKKETDLEMFKCIPALD